jgi:flagellar protein FlbD
MIKLTRLNSIPIYLNPDLIEHIDATPDTVITLTSGPKFLVLENAEDVCDKVLAYRRSIVAGQGLAEHGMAREMPDARTARLDVVHG